MQTRNAPPIVALLPLLLACHPSAVPSPVAEPYDLAEALTATAAGAPSRADCEALRPYFAKGRPSSVPTKTIAACLVYLCTQTPGCFPISPTPGPGGAGGNSGAGGGQNVAGAPAVDGLALCLASVKANPDRKQQAADNGMTITSLANSMCAPVEVQTCYARGVCK